MRVRTKVNIIYFIIILFLLGIGAIVTTALLDENNYNAKKEKTSRTSIQVSSSRTEEENTSLSSIPTTSTSIKTSTSVSSTEKRKTTQTTTKKRTTATRKTSTEEITTKRMTTTENFDYTDALNDEIWEIVRLINEERRKNGLHALEVAVDLREVAFEAVETWYSEHENAAKQLLRGYSNYRRRSNQLAVKDAANNLFSHTKDQTDITKNKNIHYVGIGLINKEKGVAGLPTIYYCIIYE